MGGSRRTLAVVMTARRFADIIHARANEAIDPRARHSHATDPQDRRTRQRSKTGRAARTQHD
ncbi:hypothetical protein BLAT2472_20471 [Burkholderia latens]